MLTLTNNELILPQNAVLARSFMRGYTPDEISSTIANTGFEELCISKNQNFSSFLKQACLNLEQSTKEAIANCSMVIVVCQSYDHRIPNASSLVQRCLGIQENVICIDLVDGCNGFVKALILADATLSLGQKCLIVSGELNSCMTKNAEISTKILFGDGLCFTTLQKTESFVSVSQCFNDGYQGHNINAQFSSPVMHMNGFEVFRFTHSFVPKMLKENSGDGRYRYVFHQASKLVIAQLLKKLSIDSPVSEHFKLNKIGNLGSGSIAAFISFINYKDIAEHQILRCVGYGAGLSWGFKDIVISPQNNMRKFIDG